MGTMFWFFAKYLATGKLRFEEGKITLSGYRMAMVPANTFREYARDMIKRFGKKKGGEILYVSCHNAARQYPAYIRENIGGEGLEIARWMGVVATASGWGKFTVEKYDDRKKMAVYRVNDSIFSALNKKKPACHMTRGLIAGTLSAIMKEDVEGIELRCSRTCEMMFQARKKWLKEDDKRLRKLAREQLPHIFRT